MARFALPLFALACLNNQYAHAETAPAPITAVVLYPGSAMIERSATVKAGMTQLDIGGLPANVDLQSVRAQGSIGIQVGQIVMRDSGKAEAPGAREAELDAALQALQDSRDALGVDAKSATVVETYLERLNGAGGGDKPGAIDAKAVAGVIEAIHRGARDAFSEIHRAEVQTREIDRKIAALQRDLERARSGARDVRSITIHLAARQAGTLKLFYQVRGAGWKPTYRAALDTTASTVELERMASVSQKTGEDWNNVSLKLSTGQPRLSPQPPQPQPRLLAYFKPVPPAENALTYGAARIGRPVAPAPPAPPAPIADARSVVPATTDNYVPPTLELQDNFSTEFTVPERISLAADGREISVPLSRQSLPARQRIRSVPRMDKAAFLTAETARPAGVWLGGDIQLFRDGDYVGATRWDAGSSATGEQLLFPFGRDDLIRVSVDRAGEESASTGLMIQRGQRQVSDLYTISSAHQTPVDLEVLEASPVSTSDEIRVAASYAPQPTTEGWERKRGVVAWDKTIAPREVWKLKVDYTISYPVEGSVTGLP
jgi:uncharacterized protein (TIGR02231 family)